MNEDELNEKEEELTAEERISEDLAERRLKEEIERYEAQNQEAYDKEVSGENFLKDRAQENEENEEDEPDAGDIAKGVSFEVAAGLATDNFTRGLLNPVFGPKGIALYGIANFVSGSVANLIAQRLRGESNISIGEILSSGAAGIIPGTTAKVGKNLTRVVGKAGTVKRAAIAGGLTGVGAEALRVGIDEKRLLDFQEAMLGGAVGGTASAGMQKLLGAGTAGLQNYARHLKGKQTIRLTPDEVLELGLEQPFASRFADELSPMSAKKLKSELDTRAVAGTYGFTYTKIGSKNRRNQLGIPNDISTVYLNHAEAYKKAMGPNDNLEKFPTLLWDGERFRPKSKGNYVYFEKYIDRKTRQKLGTSRRALRIWRQTRPGVKPGTFYREKLKQLRELNAEEARLGLPDSQRTKLREVDMDHKNALRSVEIYTEGLSEKNTKFVYDLLEKYGLFTGDDSRNLILRNREIHKLLWPRMKAALKALNHKTIADFQNTKYPELEYLKYLAGDIKNPKYSDDTPLREYIDTIKFIEEQASDQALDALNLKVQDLLQGKQANVSTPLRDRLVEILGGEENLKAFLARLKRQMPKFIQPDLIEGEFNYIGSFGPLDPKQIADILNEPS